MFGVATIFNFAVFEEIIFFMGDFNILYSIGSVMALSLSSLCLLHMVFQEIKYNHIVCKKADVCVTRRNIGIDFDDDEIEEYEIEDKAE